MSLKPFRIAFTLTVLIGLMVAAVVLLFNVDEVSAVNSGAIWTTKDDCGDESQDVNHFAAGDDVYINGSGFVTPVTYDWDITGNPGNSSGDPGIQVEHGSYHVDSDGGAFCIYAYTVATDDWGEYKVNFGGKNDNYRVEFVAPGPESQTIYYNDGCIGVYSQYQEKYWEGGPDGGYGDWVDVGDPVLVHAWTADQTKESWVAPNQEEFVEPDDCFIPPPPQSQTIYYVDGCVGVYSQYQEKYWEGGFDGDWGDWTDVGSPVLEHAWTLDYVLEYWDAPDQQRYYEPEICLIELEHTWMWNDTSNCIEDTLNPTVSDGGWYVTDMPGSAPYTFPWLDPYTLETYPADAYSGGRYTIQFFWPDGFQTEPITFYFYEPEYCLRHQTTVIIEEMACDPETGKTKFAVTLGEGVESVHIGDDIVLTETGFVWLKQGSYDWYAVLMEGYDPEGDIDGTIDVEDCKRKPPVCPECGPHIDETHIRNGVDGMAWVWFGTTECKIDWVNWCVYWDTGLRTWSTEPNYFVHADTGERVEPEIRNAVGGETCYITNQTLDPFAPWIIYGVEGERFRNWETGKMVNKYESCSVDVTRCDTHNGQGIVAGGQTVSDWAQFLVLDGACYENTLAGYSEAFAFLASVGLEGEIPWTMIGESFDLPDSCSW